MTREGALLVMVAVAAVAIALMAWGWRRRARRDAGLTLPDESLPQGAQTLAAFPVLYVATTVHDAPLERLAVTGLGFRARGTLTVTDAGLVLELAGDLPAFIAAARIVAVDQSTVAIDRVVERDGLTRLSWRIADDTVVDSYFRPQDASAGALAVAVAPLAHADSETGTQK